MKTVFKSNEIAHIWANKSAPSGKSPGAMSFYGDSFLSYGTTIARHITRKGKAAVILNETSYSVTSSSHQSSVRNALLGSAMPVFTIGGIGRGASLDFNGEEGPVLFAYAMEQAAQYGAKAERSRSENTRGWNQARSAEYLESAKEINAFFGLRRKVDEGTIARLREAAAKSERKAKLEEQAREAKYRQEQTAAYAAWLKGESNGYFNAALFPTVFRVEGGELVSSRGARVPLEAARIALGFALARRGSHWQRNGEVCAVGHYQLDAINEQGVIAGCHRIAWDEVERVSAMLA